MEGAGRGACRPTLSSQLHNLRANNCHPPYSLFEHLPHTRRGMTHSWCRERGLQGCASAALFGTPLPGGAAPPLRGLLAERAVEAGEAVLQVRACFFWGGGRRVMAPCGIARRAKRPRTASCHYWQLQGAVLRGWRAGAAGCPAAWEPPCCERAAPTPAPAHPCLPRSLQVPSSLLISYDTAKSSDLVRQGRVRDQAGRATSNGFKGGATCVCLEWHAKGRLRRVSGQSTTASTAAAPCRGEWAAAVRGARSALPGLHARPPAHPALAARPTSHLPAPGLLRGPPHPRPHPTPHTHAHSLLPQPPSHTASPHPTHAGAHAAQAPPGGGGGHGGPGVDHGGAARARVRLCALLGSAAAALWDGCVPAAKGAALCAACVGRGEGGAPRG